MYYIHADWYGQMVVGLEDFLPSASKISEKNNNNNNVNNRNDYNKYTCTINQELCRQLGHTYQCIGLSA